MDSEELVEEVDGQIEELDDDNQYDEQIEDAQIDSVEDEVEITEEELDRIADTAIAALKDILKFYRCFHQENH